jgi:hypothetical protein
MQNKFLVYTNIQVPGLAGPCEVGAKGFGLIPVPLGLLSGREFASSLESDDCGSVCGGCATIFFFPDNVATVAGHPTGVF